MRVVPTALTLLLPLLLASCFELEETITIKADGSATYEQKIRVNEHQWQQMKVEKEKGALAQANEELRKVAKHMGEGVEFVSFNRVDQVGGGGALIASFQIENINNFVHAEMQELMLRTQLEAVGAKIEMGEVSGTSFSLQGNTLSVTPPQPDLGMDTLFNQMLRPRGEEGEMLEFDREFKEKLLEESAKRQAKEMVVDYEGGSIKHILLVEPGIAKTEASMVEENEITLLNMPFDPAIEAGELWKIIRAQCTGNDYQYQYLNEIEGVKAETKERFTVELAQ